MNDKLQLYIEGLIPQRDGLLSEMEVYAREHNVPIMEPTGIEAMLQLLRLHKPEKILELGTAIGYSALRMLFALPESQVVSIERDEERIQQAEKFIEISGEQERITLVFGDALETVTEISKHAPFDAIFIDAAKGQYQKFFELYSPYLRVGGIMITDNILFRGLVAESEIESKRLRNLVKKIHEFNVWLSSHPDYTTAILPVGDGVAISIKRGETYEKA